MKNRRPYVWMLAVFAPCLLMGCFLRRLESTREGPRLMSEMHQVTDRVDAPAGYSCMTIDDPGGSSSGGGALGSGVDGSDLWYAEGSDGAGVLLTVGSGDTVLEQRHYDRAFVASRSVDQFTVTTSSGEAYSFVHWGGDTCEPCPPQGDGSTVAVAAIWNCDASRPSGMVVR